MAITDIQISEDLETNAPSIKYSGNEGPKSPQEEQMMMADAMLKEEYEKYVYDLLEIRPEATPMTLEEFKQMVIAEGQMSKGPILPSPEDPVNPFGPKPTGPPLPNRQMAAYGGIMGLDGRRQYGIGSSIKKRIRKIIPNEVAQIAEVAAPFVAPFNPIAAGLMSGVGGFDRHGSISQGLKSGLMNYGMGQIARGIGGAGMQEGFNLKINPNATGLGQYFSSPMAAKTAIGQGVSGSNKALFTSDKAMRPDLGLMEVPGKGVESVVNLSQGQGIDKISPLKQLGNKIMEYVPTSFGDVNPFGENFDIKKAGGALGIFALGKKLLGEPDQVVDEIMDRGEGLDIVGIRTEVIEAYKDPSGNKLAALRSKYPFLGKRETKDLSAMAYGGRIGRAEGGLMDLGGMEKDYRAEGGFVPIGAKEKADDVPARLSVNEFVFTADAVRNAGGGDIDKGAEVMENMMKHLEQGGQVSQESQGIQSLRAGGRAGFANGLTVDTDKVIEDIRKFSIPGLIGRGVKAGADKISDIELESIIKVIAKAAPGGMVMEKVTEFLVDRYGMTEDEAQMRIVNKLGTDANEGFKQPSGTSDQGYRMVGIESSAEDTFDIPRINRLRNLLGRAPSIKMPRPEKRFPEEDRYFPDGPGKFPERKPFRPGEGGDFERGPFRPEDGRNFEYLKDMFNTSQRLSEVVE